MRERPNWEAVARATLAEFRTASARYPGYRWFEELIEDLKQVSPEFCRWWPHHDVRSALDGHKVIEHPTFFRELPPPLDLHCLLPMQSKQGDYLYTPCLLAAFSVARLPRESPGVPLPTRRRRRCVRSQCQRRHLSRYAPGRRRM